MKTFPRKLALFCLPLIFAADVAAQNTASSKKRSPDKVAIRTKYDAVKDETSVAIDPYIAVQTDNSNLTGFIALTAGFTYAGQTLAAPPKAVELGLVTMSPYKWQFEKAKARELKVIVDGERIDLGDLDRVEFRTAPFNSIFRDRTDLYFQEKLAAFVPYETFVKMANGKKVILKIGSYDSKLDKENLETVRELASKMRP